MIAWPDDTAPEVAAIHVHNEIEAEVTPAQIWPWLIRASRWHELYTNCRGLRMPSGAGPDLVLGTTFSWRTFGVRVTTTVEELVPEERLAWRGEGLGARGYHAWLLERVGTRTRFVTEEVQCGAAPSILRPLLRRGLLHYHQRWLEGLVRAARLGHPDTIQELAA